MLIRNQPFIRYPEILLVLVLLGGWFVFSEIAKTLGYFSKTIQFILDILIYGSLLIFLVYFTGGTSSQFHFIFFLAAISIPLYYDLLHSLVGLAIITLGCFLIFYFLAPQGASIDWVKGGYLILEIGALFTISAIIRHTLNLLKEKEIDLEKANLQLKNQKQNLAYLVEEKVQTLRQKTEDLEKKNLMLSQSEEMTEKLLREIKSKTHELTAIISNIKDAICVTDQDHRIIIFNKEAERLTGLKEQNLLGQNLDRLLSLFIFKDEKNAVFQKLKPCVSESFLGKKYQNNQLCVLHQKDKKIFIELSLMKILEKNIFLGTLVIFRDITRQLELDRIKNNFLTIASHELRTPMTAIKGYLSTILGGKMGAINQQIREFLEDIYSTNERLIFLVRDFLDVSKIEEGKMSFDIRPIQILEPLKNVLKSLLVLSQERKNKLVSHPPKNLPLVKGDFCAINQIFYNLIGNAIKFTTKGKITIDLRVTKDKLIINVSDTGMGINDESKKHIFEKFYKGNLPNNLTSGGSGLGLYITKHLVEKMKGKIWFKSKMNKGSTFSFDLPLAKNN